MNLFYMESHLAVLNKNKTTVSDCVDIIDRHLDAVDQAKKSPNCNADDSKGETLLNTLDSLSAELYTLRGNAWELWCDYNQKLKKLEEAKSLWALVQFNEIKNDLYDKIDTTNVILKCVSDVSQRLESFCPGVSMKFGLEIESQPGNDE